MSRKTIKKRAEYAYLVGPFIGELFWEYYRFSPYIIYLIKQFPNVEFIVCTRPERFDFYGCYVDKLVPLRISTLESKQSCGFTITGFKDEYYKIINELKQKYLKNYEKITFIYPNISGFSHLVKWQFPRSKMDYDFKPRKKHNILINDLIKEDFVFVDDTVLEEEEFNVSGYSCKTIFSFLSSINKFVDNKSLTEWGCYIEALKKSKFMIGNLSSDFSKLALLLGKPLITVNESLSDDSIHLINPLKTLVIRCSTIQEGLETYESNF